MVASLPEKMIRKGCGGERRRSREENKVILRKSCLARFLGIMFWKNGVCVGRCICSRNHGGKKVICKKMKLERASGILGPFKSEF